MSTPTAEIYDRGYRPYDGPRAGVASSMRSVGLVTIQRALGLRRKFRYKIVPLLTIIIAYVPALAFLGIAVLLPGDLAEEVVPEYAGYFGLVTFTMILLTAFVVPEVIGSDRNTGMFGLYLASSVTRNRYLLAKGLAIGLVLSLVTMVPVIFQMLGYTLLEIGPDGFTEFMKVLGQTVIGGLILATLFTLVGMAAATLTNRQGFAAAGIVMLIIGSEAMSEILVSEADAPEWVRLFRFTTVPIDLIRRVFGEPPGEDPLSNLSTLQVFGAWATACAIAFAIVVYGYRRLQVTK